MHIETEEYLCLGRKKVLLYLTKGYRSIPENPYTSINNLNRQIKMIKQTAQIPQKYGHSKSDYK